MKPIKPTKPVHIQTFGDAIDDIDVSMNNGVCVFSNTQTGRQSMVIVNKYDHPTTVTIPEKFKTVSSLYGKRDDEKTSWETQKVSGTLTMRPMSLNVVV
jgi:hypothetical protein